MARRRNKRDTDPKKVIGYIRVSTDEQALGPDAQRDALNAWCERHDARLLAIHEDIGISGASPLEKRPGLNDALDALVLEGAGVLLVAKRDRLARDVVIAAVVERMAQRVGARLLSADETGNGDGPEDQLMRHLLSAFSEYERLLIGARTRAALRAKKAKGKRVGAIPYGYRLAEDGDTLKPDETEQTVVRIVKTMRKKGGTLRAIADELTRRAFATRTGGYWHVQTISNIARADDVAEAV
jgi:DNA invertase Pin-like site-specific DNA recombinase